MSDAVPRAAWGRRHLLTAFVIAAMFLAYTDRVNLSVAAVAMRSELGWNQSTKGVVLAAFFVGYMLFQIASGALARRYGGKRVLGLAVAWWSLFTLLTPLAATTSLTALLFARVGLGLGEGALMPASYELFSRWVPAGERGRTIGRFLGGIPLGQIVGFMLTGWLTTRLGWPASFYLFGVLGVVWSVTFLSRIENDPASDPRLTEAERRLLQPPAPAGEHAVAATPWPLFLRSGSVWALAAAHFSHNWTLYMLVSWLPSYFSEAHGVSLTGAGFYAALPWVAYFLALQASGSFSDYAIARGVATATVRRLATGGGLAIAAVSLLVLRNLEAVGPALALIVFASGAIGLAAASLVAVPLDLSKRHAPVLIGFSNTLATIPGVAGVAITGWLVDVTHTYASAFLLSACVSGGGAVLFSALLRGRALDD